MRDADANDRGCVPAGRIHLAAALTAPAATAGTIGFMHAIHSTNDIDATLAFYIELVGSADRAR